MLPLLSSPRWASACATALLTLPALTGCSEASAPEARADDAPATRGADAVREPVLGSTTAPEAPAFSGVQHRLPSGKALRNSPALYEQVDLTGCEGFALGWRATGTARNAGTDTQVFRVLVLFTDAQARAVDSASTTVTVPAGSTRTWIAARQFETTPGTSCVVRAVAGN